MVLSPGSGSLLRFLSMTRASSAQVVPLWSCQRSYNSSPLPMLSAHEATMLARPTSLSPLLGVRCCSSSPTSTASGGGLLDEAKKMEVGTPVTNDEVKVDFRQGLPHITVPLPSRNEPCIFALRPVTHTIGDLLHMLKTGKCTKQYH